MLKSLVLGTILGGVAAFLWSNVSWEILGWHEKTMLGFQNEEVVAGAIAENALKDGTYLLPGSQLAEGLTADQKKAAQAAMTTRMQHGPIAIAAVRRGGFGSFGRAIVLQLLILMAASFLLSWLLLQTSGLSYPRRVAFVAIAGLAASVIVDLPDWNWWGFSASYTLVNLADSVITWALAGLVIAAVVSRTRASERPSQTT